MLTIRIIAPTSVHGRPAYLGEIIEVSDHDARLLVALGKAEIDSAAAEDIETAVDSRADEAIGEAQYRTRTRKNRE